MKKLLKTGILLFITAAIISCKDNKETSLNNPQITEAEVATSSYSHEVFVDGLDIPW